MCVFDCFSLPVFVDSKDGGILGYYWAGTDSQLPLLVNTPKVHSSTFRVAK